MHHATKISKDAMNLKGSKDGLWKFFETGKRRKKFCTYIIISKRKEKTIAMLYEVLRQPKQCIKVVTVHFKETCTKSGSFE